MAKAQPLPPAAKAAFETENHKEPLKPQLKTLGSMSSQQSRKSDQELRFANDTVFARIAYASWFENMTMVVICFNALWIGIDTEWNHKALQKCEGPDNKDCKLPLEPVSIVVEWLFCVYFTSELTIRFLAYRSKVMCFCDGWFVFDGSLVACMLFEMVVMEIISAITGNDSGGVGPLSVLRLLRLVRMGRLVKFVPELANLAKGIAKASKSVFFILVFLLATIYVFSIIFTGAFADREKYPLTEACNSWTEFGDCADLGRDLFSNMGDSFMSLFTRGVLGDNLAETVDAIVNERSYEDGVDEDGEPIMVHEDYVGVLYMYVFAVFCFLTFCTLLNMLIGVICDVIAEAAEDEKLNTTKNLLKRTIEDAFMVIDLNADGLVSKNEWQQVKDNDEVRKNLAQVGIEQERMEERLNQMQTMLFKPTDPHGEDGEHKGLSVEELTERVVELRPDAAASALDLCLMSSQVAKDQEFFKNKLNRMKAMLEKHIEDQKSPKKNQGNGRPG